CQNQANKYCSACKLVQFCSGECQKSHWCSHKEVCRSNLLKYIYIPSCVREGRVPTSTGDSDTLQSDFGVRQYLWGNMPALDILNLEKNEGMNDMNRDFDLLFAASGDIRNVVETIVSLPGEYRGKCTAIINDNNFTIIARNIILLLTALFLEPQEAVPMMIHFWYSVALPKVMVETLRQRVFHHIHDVCKKITKKPGESLQAKTFSFGGRWLRLILTRTQWEDLREFSSCRVDLDTAQRVRRGIMLAPERVDYLDRALYNMPARMRGSTLKFREDGILLPFGASREEFSIPDPTFFQNPKVWPMKDDSNPLEGWDPAEHTKFTPHAKNDLYGSFFFYLRDVLLHFCQSLENMNIEFRLLNLDAKWLPMYFDKMLFDRIEISNICDRGCVGPHRCLSIFSSLLKPKEHNPKATMLMLFLNAVE
ncbi:hypothetical protein CC78DRAFT_426128, partial [Lojkania enalia]